MLNNSMSLEIKSWRVQKVRVVRPPPSPRHMSPREQQQPASRMLHCVFISLNIYEFNVEVNTKGVGNFISSMFAAIAGSPEEGEEVLDIGFDDGDDILGGLDLSMLDADHVPEKVMRTFVSFIFLFILRPSPIQENYHNHPKSYWGVCAYILTLPVDIHRMEMSPYIKLNLRFKCLTLLQAVRKGVYLYMML